MGAALHLAYVRQLPVRRRKRKGGGGDGDGGGPFIIIPKDACPACAEHWHHRCWGANILDDHRPDCPCPCGDPADPTGQRMSAAAWADLAQYCPAAVPDAVRGQQLRDGLGVHLCTWRRDDSGLQTTPRRA